MSNSTITFSTTTSAAPSAPTLAIGNASTPSNWRGLSNHACVSTNSKNSSRPSTSKAPTPTTPSTMSVPHSPCSSTAAAKPKTTSPPNGNFSPLPTPCDSPPPSRKLTFRFSSTAATVLPFPHLLLNPSIPCLPSSTNSSGSTSTFSPKAPSNRSTSGTTS